MKDKRKEGDATCIGSDTTPTLGNTEESGLKKENHDNDAEKVLSSSASQSLDEIIRRFDQYLIGEFGITWERSGILHEVLRACEEAITAECAGLRYLAERDASEIASLCRQLEEANMTKKFLLEESNDAERKRRQAEADKERLDFLESIRDGYFYITAVNRIHVTTGEWRETIDKARKK